MAEQPPTKAKPEHQISRDQHTRYGFDTAACLCGWTYHHRRSTITDRAVHRHLAKSGETR